MANTCVILADSINLTNDRLITFQVTYPRFIHSEFLTHRTFSRSSASSRAIPTWKYILKAIEEPVAFTDVSYNQKGMQGASPLTGKELLSSNEWWLNSRTDAVANAFEGADRTGQSQAEKAAWITIYDWLKYYGKFSDREPEHLKLHKQWVNRVLEPFVWHTAIFSGTDWTNFFALRTHQDAQPEFIAIAQLMAEQYFTHTPQLLTPGQWHLPLIHQEDINKVMSLPDLCPQLYENLAKISAARCARVSYLTQNGVRDIYEDLNLFDRLVTSQPRHLSPCEHVAVAMSIPPGISSPRSGNFKGFTQFRKMLPDENITEFTLLK